MAYLSEENSEMYRRMLSETERDPKKGSMFNPPPRTMAPATVSVMEIPKPAQSTSVSVIPRKVLPSPGVATPRQITVTGATGASSGGAAAEVAPMPKTFQQAAAAMMPEKRNFMPLVFIGGAGLLLYFLLKK
jgi:hypothetical protein